MNTEQLKQAAMAAKTDNIEAQWAFEELVSSPDKIMALLECVDALRSVRTVILVQRDLIERNKNDAAWNPTIELIDSSLQKLEAL